MEMRDAVVKGYGGEASGGGRARDPEMGGGGGQKNFFQIFRKKVLQDPLRCVMIGSPETGSRATSR